jgi:hypothetical protein
MRIGSADPGEFALSQRTLSPEEESLRKYLIAALVAVLSIAVTAVAVGQTPSTAPDVDMKFTPKNAGTKKKPKNSTLNLSVKNNQTDATVDTITVNLGKQIKLNGKGFKYCTADTLNAQGITACPSGSKAGKGSANAVVGPGKAPLGFTVDAFVGSKNSIIFYVQQEGGGTVRKALTGKVSRASGKFGSKIVIKIDEDLQQPGPGVFSSLVDLQTTIKAKRGKNYLVSSIGCKRKKHNFGVKFTFAPNATFPATGSISGTTSTKCTK